MQSYRAYSIPRPRMRYTCAMQFQVPQFIEIEDKIFGPLTFKQFVYLGGGAGTAYILWRVLPSYIAIPVMLAAAGFAGALAFLEINGRPFIVHIESAFYYLLRAKLYLWNNDRRDAQKPALAKVSDTPASSYIPKLSDSRLHELAWSLDVNERIAAGVGSDTDRAQAAPQSGIVAPVRTMRAAVWR